MAHEEIYEQVGEVETNAFLIFVIGNIVGLVTYIFFFWSLLFIQKQGIPVQLDDENGKMIVSLIFIIILHELLHYVAAWILCGIDRRYLYFGFRLRWFTFYCGFRNTISIASYKLVLIFPLLATSGICLFFFCIFLSHWTTIAISCAVAISIKDIIDFIKLRKFNHNHFVPGKSPKFGTIPVLRKKENADVEISP